MKRIGTVLMVMAVVAALLAIPLGVSAATSDHDAEPATPGEQLGGVLGVQGAALDGDLSDRTFGEKIANADSDEARADLIADRVAEIEQRIVDHEDRLADLKAKREAGEISEGRYRAQVATVEAERVNTERKADRAGDTARGLPAGVLDERGISVDRIDEIRTNASQLGGPATSKTAREIAGENVSQPIAGDRGDREDRTGVERSVPERESTDQDRRDRGDSDPRESPSTERNGNDSTDDGSSEESAGSDDHGDADSRTQDSDRENTDERPN